MIDEKYAVRKQEGEGIHNGRKHPKPEKVKDADQKRRSHLVPAIKQNGGVKKDK